MADILFVHTNFPGQYKLLAKHLAAQPNLKVFAIGSHTATELDGVHLQRYRLAPGDTPGTHSFARRFDIECRRAEEVIYAANVLKLAGMSPRIIFVHPGWGESLPLRQIFPDAKICVYCEFYYSARGADVGFDDEFQGYGIDGQTRIQLRNAATLLALVDADAGISPTHWQKNTFPREFHSKIRVIHDGISTKELMPGSSEFSHPSLQRRLRTGDEVLTFVARSLEPYRGFHVFMRALPGVLAARPKAQVCIVGGSDVSYGSLPVTGESWRDVLLHELGDQLDMARVHFLDRLPYGQLLDLLRVSRVHAYLTYPFVLSWSLLEAMALGCTVVASDVAPMREVVTDGQNGFLVPFFDVNALQQTIIEHLKSPAATTVGVRAREFIRQTYDFETHTLPQINQLIADLAPELMPAANAVTRKTKLEELKYA